MSDAPTTVAGAQQHLGELFTNLGIPAEASADGTFAIPHGPTTINVAVSQPDDRVAIDIWAPVVEATALSPDLFRFAAETSFLFGRLCVAPAGDGTGQLQLCHTMVADPLDGEVLVQCLGTVANTAADLVLQLADRFPPPR